MIVFHQILLKISHFYEPRWHCLVNQGSIASPTVRIVMHLGTALDQPSFLLDVLDNDFIGILHVNVLVCRTLLSELSVFVNWNRRIVRVDDSFWYTHLVILLPKAWCTMDNSCTRIISDKVTHLDFKAAIFLSLHKEVKHRHILFAFKIFSLEFF